MAESGECENYNFNVEKPANCEIVRFEHRKTFNVAGIQDQVLYPEIPVKVPAIIKKFHEKSTEIKNTKDSLSYGVSFDSSEQGFTFLMGKEVTKAEDLPEGFISREIPENEYAVIGYKGTKDKVNDTYIWFSCSWVVENGHEQITTAPSFEVYDERCIPEGPDADKSYFEIYMPIKKNSQ